MLIRQLHLNPATDGRFEHKAPEGVRETIRCFLCSLLRGRFLSLDHYCLRSTWELEALNDGTLQDIGIHRSAIEALTIIRK